MTGRYLDRIGLCYCRLRRYDEGGVAWGPIANRKRTMSAPRCAAAARLVIYWLGCDTPLLRFVAEVIRTQLHARFARCAPKSVATSLREALGQCPRLTQCFFVSICRRAQLPSPESKRQGSPRLQADRDAGGIVMDTRVANQLTVAEQLLEFVIFSFEHTFFSVEFVSG